MDKSKITALINLLEDENDEVAGSAIKELINSDDNLKDILKNNQETSDPILRKRIHQLQTIIGIRRNRENISNKLCNEESDLLKGLIEIHLLWYDNENESHLNSQWNNLLAKSKSFNPCNSASLTEFMKTMNFIAMENKDLEPEYYCIGYALENKISVDFMLSAIAYCIGIHYNWSGQIAYSGEGFCLIDDLDMVIDVNKWSLKKAYKKTNFKIWTNDMLMRHLIYQLFLSAVSSDCYKYIYSSGICLSKISGSNSMNFLSFPYNKNSYNNKSKSD